MEVLSSLFSYYEISSPNIPYLCSLQLSRKAWPSFKSYALTSLSEQFGLKYNAHNALDDAINCGKVFVKACNGKLISQEDLCRYLNSRGLEFKRI